MKKKGIIATLWRWIKRAFWGAGKEISEDDKFVVEKIESPSTMAVKAFFRRKLAVGALVVLISMFLFVFIGPYFFPMNLNYTDALQANMAPNNTLMKVPNELENNIKNINGFADFTVGVSKDNTLYLWGNTKNNLTNVDYAAFPDEIQAGNVAHAAAGSDHIIAITTDGKVVGWGNSSTGQFGVKKQESDPYTQMPDVLLNGTIDASKVKQLIAGYQATALVMEDGTMYMWGNNNAMLSLPEFTKGDKYNTDVEKVAFSNYYAIIMRKDGTVTGGQTLTFNMQKAYSNKDGEIKNLRTYMADRTVLDIAATNNCYAFIMDDGSIVVFGAAEYGEKDIPAITAEEKMVSINAGTRHFVAVGESGKVYTWGHNDGGQCDVAGKTAAEVYTGAKQTYLVNEDGELTDKAGFSGYVMGTDNRGRDILTRIVHGGKMTMTIGAVAVIVSTIIAIIIGCLSGYFGGWVDMLLMRITEIFSSLPFLPFAMMLSYVIRTMPIGETTRIFIIMIMLGLLSWTGLARMIRAQVLAEREKEFVLAAQSMGVKEKRIAFLHILPNVISVILVNVTLNFASCMLTESSLSYLGFGVQQPQPTWGNMLYGANNSIVIQNYWWQWVFPAIFLSIATISINIIGDTLRDVLDPKSSQEK
ncbi:MAG: ABC transporter permease subunit [Lachnospiraceae bacterium]|nr:ABC transporter permease subunit [Lachnospiraceae bacterium]MBR4060626.1 ABC transporter permease subunit [Lachnospiraceae bacterium]